MCEKAISRSYLLWRETSNLVQWNLASFTEVSSQPGACGVELSWLCLQDHLREGQLSMGSKSQEIQLWGESYSNLHQLKPNLSLVLIWMRFWSVEILTSLHCQIHEIGWHSAVTLCIQKAATKREVLVLVPKSSLVTVLCEHVCFMSAPNSSWISWLLQKHLTEGWCLRNACVLWAP